MGDNSRRTDLHVMGMGGVGLGRHHHLHHTRGGGVSSSSHLGGIGGLGGGSSGVMSNKPRFKHDMYFPEQELANESSTTYETSGPFTSNGIRLRERGGLVLSRGGDGKSIASVAGVGGMSGVGSVGDAKADTLIGAGDGLDKRGRGRGLKAGGGGDEKTEFSSTNSMALSGRGDDLLFFEAGLQEYFYRNALTTAILRIIIVVATSVLLVCITHNAIYIAFATARFIVDEQFVSLLAPFEHHPVLTFTRWVSFSWAGMLAFVVLVIAATAKRSAKLQHPEAVCRRMNSLFLTPQFGMSYDAHTDTLNVVRQ